MAAANSLRYLRFRSLCLAGQSGTVPDLKLIALFGIWCVLMKGAGCTVNDLFDKDFDAKVRLSHTHFIQVQPLYPISAKVCPVYQIPYSQ